MSPTSSQETASISTIQDASPMFLPLKELELLSKMTTGGLQVLYRYTRKPHLFSASMTSIQLTLNNLGQNDLNDIKIGTKTLAPGMALHDFPCKLVIPNSNITQYLFMYFFSGIAKLNSGASQSVNIGINFNDSTQTAKFDLVSSGRIFCISIQAPVGELVKAVTMSEAVFDQEKSKLR